MGKQKGVGKSRFGLFFFILGFLSIVVLLFFRGELWLKRFLIYLSHASWGRTLASSLPIARQVARRFVAGETIDEAMSAAKALNDQGMSVTLDYLGESVSEIQEAEAARDEILLLLDQIDHLGIIANVSVKLTQLGLRISSETALANMREIMLKATSQKNKVRIDMEESDLVDDTLALFRTLRFSDGFDNVGVVIQAYLYRSESDVQQLIEDGSWVRLCKGAYAEPADVAFPDKVETDVNFIKLTEMMLSSAARKKGVYLGIATHDERMIEAAMEFAASEEIPQSDFEFQMLYGIRRDLQDSLVRQGYQVRIYVPYGTAWYPYLVRRLAERPANLWFFVSNLFKR